MEHRESHLLKDGTTSTLCSCPENTWVYVWKMTPEKVGHTAIQVGGCQPKTENKNHGEYISIHPKLFPSIGPTTLLPLPAGVAYTLSEDMAAEAEANASSYLNSTGDPSNPPLFTRNETEIPKLMAPDCTFKVKNLNTSAMLKLIIKTRDEVQTGQTSYQLFPKINTYKLFMEIPRFVSYNPIDVTYPSQTKHDNQLYGATRQNCATLVSDILSAGGIVVKQQSFVPWGKTPNDVADLMHNIANNHNNN
eukprot:gene6182-8516_t